MVTDVEESQTQKYLYILVGFIAGVLLTVGAFKIIVNLKAKREERDIIKAVKKAKSDKGLFNLLLPYANRSPKIKEALDRLERNIYRGENNKIDKRGIIEELEDILNSL